LRSVIPLDAMREETFIWMRVQKQETYEGGTNQDIYDISAITSLVRVDPKYSATEAAVFVAEGLNAYRK
jgi:hypothetical protein